MVERCFRARVELVAAVDVLPQLQKRAQLDCARVAVEHLEDVGRQIVARIRAKIKNARDEPVPGFKSSLSLSLSLGDTALCAHVTHGAGWTHSTRFRLCLTCASKVEKILV